MSVLRPGFPQIAASVTGLALVVMVTFGSSAQNTQNDIISEKGISGIEGPAVDADGNLYFVSRNKMKDGKILQLKPGAKKSELYAPLTDGRLGNGIRFDKEGRMYVADFNGHNVLFFEKGQKKDNVYFTTNMLPPGATKFNQPNDLAIGNDGTIYASDPKGGKGAIWRITRDAKGKTTGERMTNAPRNAMGMTNGIDLSPDGKTLYVSESLTREVWAYKIDGAKLVPLSTKALKTFDGPKNSELDGLRTDASGRIFVTRPRNPLAKSDPPCGTNDERCIGTIAILKPDGTLEREIRTIGRNPSNLTFGGPDGKTVFVTQVDGGFIETFRVDTPGREPCLQFGAPFC
jgi:signal peptidase